METWKLDHVFFQDLQQIGENGDQMVINLAGYPWCICPAGVDLPQPELRRCTSLGIYGLVLETHCRWEFPQMGDAQNGWFTIWKFLEKLMIG